MPEKFSSIVPAPANSADPADPTDHADHATPPEIPPKFDPIIPLLLQLLSQVEEAKFEHGDGVCSVVWSPDGQKVATASDDKTCRIFDVASTTEEAKFQHGRCVRSVAWSPDGQKVATASEDKTCRIWSSWKPPLSYTKSCFLQSIHVPDSGFDTVCLLGILNVTVLGLLCYLRLFQAKRWIDPKLEEELQLVERKPTAGWDLMFRTDAAGMSPMSLAIESGNVQWMAAYINKHALNFCHQEGGLNYQTKCQYLTAASGAITKMLADQTLGSLSDPLSELLKLFVLPVETNPHSGEQAPKQGNAAIQLYPIMSEHIWWPQGFAKEKLPTGAGYDIAVTAEILVMPHIVSSDFLAQLCEHDIPDAVAVFSSDPIVAAIQFKWQTWRWYFYAEFLFYCVFQGLYTWVTVEGTDAAYHPCIDVNDTNSTDDSDEDVADALCFPVQVWGPKVAVTVLAVLIVLREWKELFSMALEEHDAKFWAAKRFLRSLLFSWSFTGTFMPVLVTMSIWFAELLQWQPIIASWSWLYALYFLGGLDTTGAYVSMLWEVIADMWSFFVVLLLVILGLGHSFSLAAHNDNTWNQLQRVYRMGILGDFEVDDYQVHNLDLEQHPMLYFFFILVTVAITIAMLNLLIAVISDTYDRVKQDMSSRLNRSKAARIAELERAYGKFRIRGRYLMFLRPTHRSDLPDWQGKADYLGKIIPKKIQATLQGGKLKDVEGKLTDVDQKLENELKEIRGTLTDVDQKLENELKEVHGTLTDVEGKLTDVEQKLEKELKEVHGTLTDIQSLLADTFRTDAGSSRFRTNDATSAEDMVDDLEWDIPVLE